MAVPSLPPAHACAECDPQRCYVQADLGSKQLPVLKQKVLLGLLQVVDEVLSEANIPYWMTGGTLLGALRHEGFIPHDDDVDLECFEEDTPRIKAAFAASSLPGHFVESGHWEGQRMARLVFWEVLVLDLFLRRKPLEAEPCFPSDQEVFPLQRYAFHDLLLPGLSGSLLWS